MRTAPAASRRTAACAVLALASAGLLSAGQVARAEAPEIDAGGSTLSSAVTGVLEPRPGLIVVQDLVHAESAYTTTTFATTGGATARAASYFPGEGPLAVPGLACSATPVCQTVAPPAYPLMADASHPTKPEAKAAASGGPQVVGPLSTTPALVRSAASERRTDAEVAATALGLAGVTVEKARSSSSQVVQDGALVLRSRVVLEGVTAPGDLRLDQVLSESTVRVLPDRTSTGSARTTVSGATVGGVPATVSASGVSVQGQGDGGAAGEAAQEALSQLAAAGVEARLLPPKSTLEQGKGAATTGGLLVTVTREVTAPSVPAGGLPSPSRTYVSTLNLAVTGVNGFASPAAALDDVPLPEPPPAPATAAEPPAAGEAGPPALSGSTGAVEVPPLPAGDVEPPALAAADVPAAPGSDVLPGDDGAPPPLTIDRASAPVSSEDLRALAAALLLYPLVVLAAALRRSPARLPGLLRRS